MTQTPSTLEAPAEISQLAASRQLGDLFKGYRRQGALQIIGTGLGIMLLGIALLLVGGWLLDTFHLTGIIEIIIARPAALVGLGLFFYGPISLIKKLVTKTNEIYLYSNGFIIKTPEQQLEACSWSQIRGLDHQAQATTKDTAHQYTIKRSTEYTVTLYDNINQVSRLVSLPRKYQPHQ